MILQDARKQCVGLLQLRGTVAVGRATGRVDGDNELAAKRGAHLVGVALRRLVTEPVVDQRPGQRLNQLRDRRALVAAERQLRAGHGDRDQALLRQRLRSHMQCQWRETVLAIAGDQAGGELRDGRFDIGYRTNAADRLDVERDAPEAVQLRAVPVGRDQRVGDRAVLRPPTAVRLQRLDRQSVHLVQVHSNGMAHGSSFLFRNGRGQLYKHSLLEIFVGQFGTEKDAEQGVEDDVVRTVRAALPLMLTRVLYPSMYSMANVDRRCKHRHKLIELPLDRVEYLAIVVVGESLVPGRVELIGGELFASSAPCAPAMTEIGPTFLFTALTILHDLVRNQHRNSL